MQRSARALLLLRGCHCSASPLASAGGWGQSTAAAPHWNRPHLRAAPTFQLPLACFSSGRRSTPSTAPSAPPSPSFLSQSSSATAAPSSSDPLPLWFQRVPLATNSADRQGDATPPLHAEVNVRASRAAASGRASLSHLASLASAAVSRSASSASSTSVRSTAARALQPLYTSAWGRVLQTRFSSARSRWRARLAANKSDLRCRICPLQRLPTVSLHLPSSPLLLRACVGSVQAM